MQIYSEYKLTNQNLSGLRVYWDVQSLIVDECTEVEEVGSAKLDDSIYLHLVLLNLNLIFGSVLIDLKMFKNFKNKLNNYL